MLAVGDAEDAGLVPAVGHVDGGGEAVGHGALGVGGEGRQDGEVALDRARLTVVGVLRHEAEGGLLVGGEAGDVDRDGLGAVGLGGQRVGAVERRGVRLEGQPEGLDGVVVVVEAGEGEGGPLLILHAGGGQVDRRAPRAVGVDRAGALGALPALADGPHEAGLLGTAVGAVGAVGGDAAGAGDGEGHARVGDARVVVVDREAVLLVGEGGGGDGGAGDDEGGGST